MDKEEQQLLTLIPKGMDRPRPLKELVTLTGWNSRKVRATIYRLIVVHHQPIGAKYEYPNNGYFQIANNDERMAALAPLTSQIAQITRRAEAISNANLEDQE